jgi:nucleoside 2-deoxyribosyltransferase
MGWNLIFRIVFCLALVPSTALCETSSRARLYLASPLGFSESGKNFKDTVLKPALVQLGFDVIDPWTLVSSKRLAEVTALPSGSTRRKAAWQQLDLEIGKQNQSQIDQADAVLAILDGSDVDSGTAAEVGYAFAKKKKIFGYRSDFRLASDNEGALVNLQVEYFIKASGGRVVTQVSQLHDGLNIEKANNDSATPTHNIEDLKAATRSILDAFTIFPFAIVLALALSEAFKMVISEKTTEKYIEPGKLYALASFLLLILPFYQGMNKYLLITYGEFAEGPKPNSVFLIVDGVAFMLESAIFFAMSRTLGLEHWTRFYWVVFGLLTVDSIWGASVFLHSNDTAATVVEHWTLLNVVTISLLVLLVTLGKNIQNKHIPAALGMAGMLVRTIIDYAISWNFYFPSQP